MTRMNYQIQRINKLHLQELSNVVDFIFKKFDTYEQERKERERER